MTASRRARPSGCFGWLWLPCFSSSIVVPDGADRSQPSAPPLSALSGRRTNIAPTFKDSDFKTDLPPPPVFQGGVGTESYQDPNIAKSNLNLLKRVQIFSKFCFFFCRNLPNLLARR